MKIGILTFHWATNYGAVLQAYALQRTLENMGHEVVLVDYYPPKYKKTFLNACMTKRLYLIPKKIREVQKEKKFILFREKYLKRTAYYPSRENLRQADLDIDCYICGSDQVWNPSFVRYSESNKNFVYFLDFVREGKKRVSYAASFGTTQYPKDLEKELARVFADLDAISVREQSGVEIVRVAGREAVMVPDPTLLLKASDYMPFVQKNDAEKYFYTYMLHGRNADALPVMNAIRAQGLQQKSCADESIEQWLSNIYNAEYIVTNSFHGTVFAILFHRPFTSVLIEKSGMNDRITTLLHKLGLESRIYDDSCREFDTNIDWVKVEEKIDIYKRSGYAFLEEL